MRKLLSGALALLLVAPTAAFAAGAFVTKTPQTEIGNQTPMLYYDMSGTGAGPFQRVTICSDGNGGLCGAISPTQGALSQPTDISCAAATACQISGLAARRYLSITNTTAGGVCRIGYGIAPTANRGDPLGGAAAAGGQGGARTFEASFAPTGAVVAFCSVASTLAVMEAP